MQGHRAIRQTKETRHKARDSPGRRGDAAVHRAEKEAGRTAARGVIDYRVFRFTAKQRLQYGAMALGLGAGLAWLFYHSIRAAPVALLMAAIWLHMKKKQLSEERKRRLNYRFRDFLAALHTSLLAGYSLENGVRSAVEDLERLYGAADPLCRELREIVRQVDYRQPIEDLFYDFGVRSDVEDIRSFGEIVRIAKRTGGNMSQVLTATWRNLSEKIDTRQEIDALTAAKRYEQSLLSFMPAGIILYLQLTFEDMLSALYGNARGVIIMSACLAVYMVGFFLGRKMAEIRV